MATLEEVLADVTMLLARYSAALSVDGGSKLLTLNRAGAGDTAAVVIQQAGAERFRMGQIGADTFALQRSPSGSAVDYTDVLSVNRSTGAVTISGSLSASVSGATGSFTSLFAGSLQVGSATQQVQGTAGAVLIGLADGDTGFFKPNFNTIGVSVGGVEAMRIDSLGRVGIGTSTPGALLEVSTGAFHTRFAGNSVTFSRDGPSYIDALAGSASILYRAAASHQMHVGGVEIARFGPAGLGIGKNATLPLDVAGTGRFVQAASGATAHGNYDNLIVEHSASAGITIMTPSGNLGGLMFKDPDNTGIGDGGLYYNHATDSLVVWAGNAEAARFVSGKLLVGASTPGASKLRFFGLPTSAAGLSAGDVWNDGGTLKIA